MESTITAKLATNTAKAITGDQNSWLTFWLSSPSQTSFSSVLILEIVTTLVFLLSLALVFYKIFNSKLTPPDHKFLTRSFWLSVFFGPVGWLLIIFRNLEIPLLSARVFWLIWFGLLAWVVYYLYRYFSRTLPKSKQTYASYQLKKRYFPKKKKK